MSLQEARENRRNWVRICITYAAAFYIFVGSIIFTWFLFRLDESKSRIVREVFFAVLPIASSIVTYWFASRKPKDLLPVSSSERKEEEEES